MLRFLFGFLFSFRGRLRRSRYLLTLLAAPLALWFAPAVGAEVLFWLGFDTPIMLATSVAMVAVVLALAAMTVRRLHDIGTTGFWALALLAPWVGWLIYLLIMFWPSQDGDNRYGPDPYPAEAAPSA